MLARTLFFLTALTGCRTTHAASEAKLIGGTVATAGQLPASLSLGDCTAVKVAPGKILTAAHCVTDKTSAALRDDYTSGRTLAIRYGPKYDSADVLSAEIVVTAVHPAYAARLREYRGRSAPDSVFSDVPDLALISLATDVSEIVPAEILYTLAGRNVVISGYGCEHEAASGFGTDSAVANAPASTNPGKGTRLKFGRTRIDRLEPVYMTFRDQTDDGGEVTLRLCPGDSGGPVYLDERTASGSEMPFLKVIGINMHTGAGYSAATRLDNAGKFRIATCLRQAVATAAKASTTDLPELCQPD